MEDVKLSTGMFNVMANISNTTSGADFTTFDEYKVGIAVWRIVPPILIIVGTFGNCLSIFVFTRKTIRSSTTALYLTILAFSDLVVLYSGLLRQWLVYFIDIDVRQINEFGCKLNIWLVYSFLDFSAWILVGVTLERVISAWFPHNTKILCSKRCATGLLVVFGVLILGLNSHLLYGMVFKIVSDKSGHAQLRKCVEVNKGYYDFCNITWPWIDLCAFCVIPLTLIVIGNGLILFKLITHQKKIQSRIVPSSAHNMEGQTTLRPFSKPSSTTAMLFTLNTVFLISTSPISIYNIGYLYWTEGASELEYAQLELWWAIVNMLMYLNNSVNFLLYCLSGAKFRREVFRILCFLKQNQVHVIDEVHENL